MNISIVKVENGYLVKLGGTLPLTTKKHVAKDKDEVIKVVSELIKQKLK